MRILSNFKEYYDGLQDPTDTLLFKRLEKDLNPIPKTLKKALEFYGRMPGSNIFRYQNRDPLDNCFYSSILVCCGKVYPIYELLLHHPMVPPAINIRINRFYSDLMEAYEDVLTLPERTESKSFDEQVRGLKKSVQARLSSESKLRSMAYYQKYFEPLPISYESCALFEKEVKEFRVDDQVFRELDTPMFMVTYRSGINVVTLNPRISKTNIPKLLPPWKIYQELDMFLGNNMAKQEERGFTGSDEVRRDQHGFDEWSFKQYAPGQKKLRRKANKLKKKNKENDT